MSDAYEKFKAEQERKKQTQALEQQARALEDQARATERQRQDNQRHAARQEHEARRQREENRRDGKARFHFLYCLLVGWWLAMILIACIVPLFFAGGRRLIKKAFGIW